MHRKISLVLAVLLLLALFSGCGGQSNSNTAGNNTANTETNSGSDNQSVEETETPAPEEDSPYNLAAGKFAADENGYATANYDYELPLSTTDEIFTFWTTCWMPSLIPEGGYGTMELPQMDESMTGVHIEYSIVTGETRAENFAVLLAANDLCDFTAAGISLYKGSITDAIYNEEFFVNLFDYKEYAPNYFYEVVNKNPDDEATYAGVFYDEKTVPAFYALGTEAVIQLGSTIRADWLDELGINRDDIVTFDDLMSVLKQFKVAYNSPGPWGMLNVVDMQGSYTLNGFDTLPYLSAEKLSPVYQINGKVELANASANDKALLDYLHSCYTEGLIHPDWQSKATNGDYKVNRTNNEIGYVATNPTGTAEYASENDDPDCYWLPLHKLLQTPGQTIHVGANISRKSYGSTSISTDCENIPLAVTWCDWRYSKAGSFLYSYGVEGVTWNYDAEGNVKLTEFVTNNPAGVGMDWVMIVYTLNQLTEGGLEDVNRKYAREGAEELAKMNAYWSDFMYDGAYEWPAALKLSDEQQTEVSNLSGDVATYMAENYIGFIDGSVSLDTWNSYLENTRAAGAERILEIYQEALDDYLAG
jgi:putative aldouronate transport system substrate-binding protein